MNKLLIRTALAVSLLAPLCGWAQAYPAIEQAPPPLPIYAQPPIPGDGYIWTPGYWAWNAAESDYYWVPGTWVLAPMVGQLWTPGYWAFEGSGYLWHLGYWGLSVGYYGGLNYGYGYTGVGYQGGRWVGDRFHYNRAVSNLGSAQTSGAYSARVIRGSASTHVSYNGGVAGRRAEPTRAERGASTGEHGKPTDDQLQHEHAALSMPAQRSSTNHGAPMVAATPRPSGFGERGSEQSRAPLSSHVEQPRQAPVHIQPMAHAQAPSEMQGHGQEEHHEERRR